MAKSKGIDIPKHLAALRKRGFNQISRNLRENDSFDNLKSYLEDDIGDMESSLRSDIHNKDAQAPVTDLIRTISFKTPLLKESDLIYLSSDDEDDEEDETPPLPSSVTEPEGASDQMRTWNNKVVDTQNLRELVSPNIYTLRDSQTVVSGPEPVRYGDKTHSGYRVDTSKPFSNSAVEANDDNKYCGNYENHNRDVYDAYDDDDNFNRASQFDSKRDSSQPGASIELSGTDKGFISDEDSTIFEGDETETRGNDSHVTNVIFSQQNCKISRNAITKDKNNKVHKKPRGASDFAALENKQRHLMQLNSDCDMGVEIVDIKHISPKMELDRLEELIEHARYKEILQMSSAGNLAKSRAESRKMQRIIGNLNQR